MKSTQARSLKTGDRVPCGDQGTLTVVAVDNLEDTDGIVKVVLRGSDGDEWESELKPDQEVVVDDGVGTVITGKDNIRMVGYLQLAHRLALEINTGMGFRQSSLTAARSAGFTKSRRKIGALKDIVAIIKANHPDPNWEPSGAIAKALAK